MSETSVTFDTTIRNVTIADSRPVQYRLKRTIVNDFRIPNVPAVIYTLQGLFRSWNDTEEFNEWRDIPTHIDNTAI